jgi:hypothetical protein
MRVHSTAYSKNGKDQLGFKAKLIASGNVGD